MLPSPHFSLSCHGIVFCLPAPFGTWHRHTTVLASELCTYVLESMSLVLCLLHSVSLGTTVMTMTSPIPSVPCRVKYKLLVLSHWDLEHASSSHEGAYKEFSCSSKEDVELQVCSILCSILILDRLSELRVLKKILWVKIREALRGDAQCKITKEGRVLQTHKCNWDVSFGPSDPVCSSLLPKPGKSNGF